jgi:hypothetical protein
MLANVYDIENEKQEPTTPSMVTRKWLVKEG